MNAQGEDVVAGMRTPRPVDRARRTSGPRSTTQLMEVRQTLERSYRDMQDIEFTIEQGRLYMLQTRNGKRTGLAAIRIAVDMVDEGLITPDEAAHAHRARAAQPAAAADLRRRRARSAAVKEGRVLAKGLPAGPGAATGRVVFNAADAEAWAERGEKVLLVRDFDEPRGHPRHGRRRGHPHRQRRHDHATPRWSPGRWARSASSAATRSTSTTRRARMTVDGRDGQGRRLALASTAPPARSSTASSRRSPSEVLQVLLEKTHEARGVATSTSYYAEIMEWADKTRHAAACAPTPTSPTRRPTPSPSAPRASASAAPSTCSSAASASCAMREMILAETPRGARGRAGQAPAAAARRLRRHLPRHGRAPGDHPHARPAAARVPAARRRRTQREIAARDGRPPRTSSRAKVEALHEINPMLGHRGCRLGITYPEITEMQARAILEAACDGQEGGHRRRTPRS